MTTATTQGSGWSFTLRRLHSLSGVVPIGVFLLMHLYFSMYAWQGAQVYNAKILELRQMPTAWGYLIFESVFIYLPILFHGLYGLFLTRDATFNLDRYPLFGNLNYILQRVSGVGLFLFIGAHTYKARIGPLLAGTSNTPWQHVHEGFSVDQSGLLAYVTLTVYLLGTAGAAYHLANGLWLFAIRWGLVSGEHSMKKFRVVCLSFYAILQVIVLISIAGFYFGPGMKGV